MTAIVAIMMMMFSQMAKFARCPSFTKVRICPSNILEMAHTKQRTMKHAPFMFKLGPLAAICDRLWPLVTMIMPTLNSNWTVCRMLTPFRTVWPYI